MTTTPSPQAMEKRIARFDELRGVAHIEDSGMPVEALDVLYARKLLPAIVLDDDKTSAAGLAPIVGAAGMTMTFLISPPGQGPSLHAHVATYETFTVLKGTYEFTWGDEGEHTVELNPFDVISFPPGVNRAFRNSGTTEGLLQAVITGHETDVWDVSLTPGVAEKLSELGVLEEFEKRGFVVESGRWLHKDKV